MSNRFRICLIVWITVVLIAAMTGELQAQPPTVTNETVQANEVILQPVTPAVDDSDWVIEISPARKVKAATEVVVLPVADQAGVDEPLAQPCGTALANASRYKQIYDSIPFNRTEYNANPSYRHDAAMEILTGNSRHLTVVRHGAENRPPRANPNPGQIVVPYGYARPALRFNYYRHFPSMNPYWNMFWNFSGVR